MLYEVEIDAPPDAVWRTLTDKEAYSVWVKAFSPNSYCDGEWVQGTLMRFLDPDMGGTEAILEVIDPPRRILVRHTALISKEGEVSTEGEMADKWLGTTEGYRITDTGGGSKLAIEILTDEYFRKMFDNAWPKALASIKQLSEQA